MNPILLISMVSGLMPLNHLNPKRNIIMDYALMLIIPVIYLSCYFFVSFGTFGIYQLTACTSTCRLANILFMHVGCFLYVAIYLPALIRRKAFFVKFEKCLYEIDEILHKCERVVGDRIHLPPKKHLYYFTLLLIVFIFIFDVGYDIKEMFHYYEKYFGIAVMVSTFPFFVASIVQGQFIYYVSIILERFGQLNSLFEKINKECDKKNTPISVFDIETDAKETSNSNLKNRGIYAGINHRQQQQQQQQQYQSKFEKNQIDAHIFDDYNDEKEYLDDHDDDYSAATTRVTDGRTSEANLPNLFMLHDKILALSELTNSEFGTQCVPYMAVCFAMSIYGIFLETKVYFVVGGKNPILDYVIFMYTIWSLTTMAVAYLVLRYCYNTYGNSKQSAMFVHEIMMKKPAFMLGNDIYYNKMKSFTLQFLHWEGYFQFNGIGLFTLDYTFIFSSVSAATSYLIVLLQFDMNTVLKNEGLS